MLRALTICAALICLSTPVSAAGGKLLFKSTNSGTFDQVVHNSQAYTTGSTDGTTTLNFKNGTSIDLYGHCEYYFSPSLTKDVEGWCRSKTQLQTDSIEMIFDCVSLAPPSPSVPIPNRKCSGTITGGTGMFQNATGTLDWETTTINWTLNWSRATSKGEGKITY